jgi:membrane protease YdiL (CAAX protease family)
MLKRQKFTLLGLRVDARLVIITIASTLLLMLDAYHNLIPAAALGGPLRAKAVERVLYYLVIPLVLIILVFRDHPKDYGLTLGDWREGLKWSGVVMLIAVPVLWLASRSGPMVAYYAAGNRGLGDIVTTAGLDLIGWEFLFRGLILFGLLQVIGPEAVILQAVPFAMAHIGKPEIETLSTIFGGILFGWVAWRSRSFVYPFLIHWFINVFVVVVAAASVAR